ncbi:phosphopantetheine-binding protein [Streptomyces sp. NPDC086554]|uniref:acyl carrier protein n=1 Tax=Streptomyces sp. NPDC086554 TaxID=3154864 RepID=UPI00343F9523
MNDSYQLITSHLAEHFGLDPAMLTPDRTFNDLEMDSIALVELLVILEEGTGVQLTQDASAFTADVTLSRAAELLTQARQDLAAARAAS